MEVRGFQAAVVLSLALILPIIFYLLDKEEAKVASKRLVLGVISAREHFSQREAVRQTWGRTIQGIPGIETKFVLGDQDCSIHPTDRISPNSCALWHLAQDIENYEPQKFFTINNNGQLRKTLQNLSDCHTGIGFRVLHPLVIEMVMVPMDVIERVKNILITLKDSEEVIEAVKPSLSNCLKSGDNFCGVKFPHRLRLPRGFEGELTVFSEDKNEDLCGDNFYDLLAAGEWTCDWSNGSVIEYKFLRTRRGTLTKWHSSACSLVSVEFTISDTPALIKHQQQQTQRTEAWRKHLDDVFTKVEEEQRHHQDLLLLPHLDVYSALPRKVMLFFKWATQNYNFSYVMKVDDDTLVNASLLDQLVGQSVVEEEAWWSHFKYYHRVPSYGKWADFTYPSLTYPAFPSGSGYIMTRRLAQSVVGAEGHLVPHGGEDVSMAIWVSTVCADTKYIDVPCWLPDAHCPNSVLVPQLSVEQMLEIWQN